VSIIYDCLLLTIILSNTLFIINNVYRIFSSLTCVPSKHIPYQFLEHVRSRPSPFLQSKDYVYSRPDTFLVVTYRFRYCNDMHIRTSWNMLLWLPHMTSRVNLMQNGKMSMAFPGSFSNSFFRHFTKISAFSDCTAANCSNMLKWNVGPMSFLSWNHCFPKEIYCYLLSASIQSKRFHSNNCIVNRKSYAGWRARYMLPIL